MNRLLRIVAATSILAVASLAQQERGLRLVIKDPESGQEIQPYNDSWAILVGIDKYKNVRGLDYAVADAQAMRKLLVEKFAFPEHKIFLLTDEAATQESIKKAFGGLYRANPDDRVIVFFAGHGETIELATGGQMGFLMPVEGKAKTAEELYSTGISMQTVKELSSFIPAKHVLFLIDACYGGLAATGARSLSKETKGYIKKVTAARSRQILTAGGRGEQVVERSEWGHSAFTYKLLDGLGRGLADLDNDGIIRGSELASYIQLSVSAVTANKQTPQFRSFTEDEGEFLFITSGLGFSVSTSKGSSGLKSSTIPDVSIKPEKPDKDIFDISDIEREVFKEKIEKEKEEKRISSKLQEVKVAFARVKAIDTSAAAAEIKITAWRRFLSVFSEDITETTEDDLIRKEAENRLAWWNRTFGRGVSVITNWYGMRFVRIEPGQFDMGDYQHEYEKPVHKVTITRPFLLGMFEVTQSQWVTLMGTNPSLFKGDDLPVINVSWEDVQTFIRISNAREGTTKYRLPTETEWEYACKLGPLGQYIDDEAWHEGNSNGTIQKVGQKVPTQVSLYDMLGNVWEWCSDWVGQYDGSPKVDPQGPQKGISRIVRGGAWDTKKNLVRTTASPSSTLEKYF